MRATALTGLDPCVHCGFCLQSCPTYLVTGDEADGPRGRIVLLRALAAGRLGAEDAHLRSHLDRCLGCLGCEPVCPSGVRYGPALEEARRTLTDARPAPALVRVLHAVMAEPALRVPALLAARAARSLASVLAGRSPARFVLGMLAATRPTSPDRVARPRRAAPAPAAPTASGMVALFRGCIMDGLFAHVHDATERALNANGYRLIAVRQQGCCGALHTHSGQHEQAVALARRNIRAFATLPQGATVAVNAAGCGAMLKEYGRLLADDPLAADAAAFSQRVRDVAELLAARGPRGGAPLDLRIAHDPPCHLLHAQGIAAEPTAVLAAVPGLSHVRHAEPELCCGSAGSYSFAQFRLSSAVLDRKIDALLSADPDLVATANPGCVMQIGAGLLARGRRVPVVHPVEVLDWAYAAAGYYAPGAPPHA